LPKEANLLVLAEFFPPTTIRVSIPSLIALMTSFWRLCVESQIVLNINILVYLAFNLSVIFSNNNSSKVVCATTIYLSAFCMDCISCILAITATPLFA